MFHKGLNKEIIVDTAKELIEGNGFDEFSMRKLADRLEVKTASLYRISRVWGAVYRDRSVGAETAARLSAGSDRRKARRQRRIRSCGELSLLCA